MANMTYCRFRNTLGDFEDCIDEIESRLQFGDDHKLSREEMEAARALIERAARLLNIVADEQNTDMDEVKLSDIRAFVDKLNANEEVDA